MSRQVTLSTEELEKYLATASELGIRAFVAQKTVCAVSLKPDAKIEDEVDAFLSSHRPSLIHPESCIDRMCAVLGLKPGSNQARIVWVKLLPP